MKRGTPRTPVRRFPRKSASGSKHPPRQYLKPVLGGSGKKNSNKSGHRQEVPKAMPGSKTVQGIPVGWGGWSRNWDWKTSLGGEDLPDRNKGPGQPRSPRHAWASYWALRPLAKCTRDPDQAVCHLRHHLDREQQTPGWPRQVPCSRPDDKAPLCSPRGLPWWFRHPGVPAAAAAPGTRGTGAVTGPQGPSPSLTCWAAGRKPPGSLGVCGAEPPLPEPTGSPGRRERNRTSV